MGVDVVVECCGNLWPGVRPQLVDLPSRPCLGPCEIRALVSSSRPYSLLKALL